MVCCKLFVGTKKVYSFQILQHTLTATTSQLGHFTSNHIFNHPSPAPYDELKLDTRQTKKWFQI